MDNCLSISFWGLHSETVSPPAVSQPVVFVITVCWFMKRIQLRQIDLMGVLTGQVLAISASWFATSSCSVVPALEMDGRGHSRAGEELDRIIFSLWELQLLKNHSVRAVAMGEGSEQGTHLQHHFQVHYLAMNLV